MALAESDLFGEGAPTYLTLKRWAGAGMLNAAQVLPPDRSRTLYKLDEVVRIALARPRRRNASPPARPDSAPGNKTVAVAPAGMAPSTPIATVADRSQSAPAAPAPAFVAASSDAKTEAVSPAASVADTLAQIAQTLLEIRDALTRRDQSIDNGLANLDATRKMLMSKYDGETQGLKNRLADVERDNANLRRTNSVVEVGKLNVLMSKVSDQLAAAINDR